ncbi:uncharacterized protein LOC126278962 isoform X1 [Schistocerca gregaria]|uniref:uncharacterized protein LOC126278962 isoform X1 n=1 Tax=Schistocerca gregaria TaxID=7010 RepID=UPI00211EE14E|nr:uncharacterized protein LOC126278962 isoform X1 [Schistocerca gregaria]XP_049835204.1 uncharacterized protein LOC126278962 isoform X1 [Schistocerca gregaria]
MMSSHSSFILAFILTIFTYYSAASYKFIRKDHVFEECNIMSQCDDNGTEIGTSNFTLTDFNTGSVKVLLPGSFERQLTLYTCEDTDPEDTLYVHSIYNCEMPSENVSSDCSYQEVILHYLFTSCYYLYNNNNVSIAYGCVQTNYTDDALKKDCSNKAEAVLVQEKYTLISLNITPFLHNSVLKFFVDDANCTRAPNNDDFWWSVEIKEDQNDDVITEKNETQNRTVDCAIVLNEEVGIRQLRCEVNRTDISCIMVMRQKSNNPINDGYCNQQNVTYTIIDPLRPYDNVEGTFPAADVSRTKCTLFLMIIPLIAVVCVYLRLYFSDEEDKEKEKDPDRPEPLPYLKCKVLLLYPQDCDSFMATMKSLKIFLQSFNCFEVYDYFDPKRFGEIACDPQGWVSSLLSHKDVRIILAETDTALLHQLAIAKICVVNYVSPLPYSNLFAYGLQNLLQSLRPQEYSRIFLIRFEDITQDKEILKLSRYQRYKLPEHVRNLISNMSNHNLIPFKEIEESIEMKRLKHSIDKFRQFQQQNPTYHTKICDNLTKLI